MEPTNSGLEGVLDGLRVLEDQRKEYNLRENRQRRDGDRHATDHLEEHGDGLLVVEKKSLDTFDGIAVGMTQKEAIQKT